MVTAWVQDWSDAGGPGGNSELAGHSLTGSVAMPTLYVRSVFSGVAECVRVLVTGDISEAQDADRRVGLSEVCGLPNVAHVGLNVYKADFPPTWTSPQLCSGKKVVLPAAANAFAPISSAA